MGTLRDRRRVLWCSLHRPIFDAQPWHFLKVRNIARQQRGPLGQGDTGDSQVHGTDADTLLLEVLHDRRRSWIKRD